jgi:hypothetical protein
MGLEKRSERQALLFGENEAHQVMAFIAPLSRVLLLSSSSSAKEEINPSINHLRLSRRFCIAIVKNFGVYVLNRLISKVLEHTQAKLVIDTSPFGTFTIH